MKLCRQTALGILLTALLYGLTLTVSASEAENYRYCTQEDGTVELVQVLTPISGDVVIPETVDGKTVSALGEGLFWGCDQMTSLTIPETVITIGNQAFYGCDGLTSVTYPNHENDVSGDFIIIDRVLHSYRGQGGDITLPTGITAIGDQVFQSCYTLQAVIIPHGVVTLGSQGFYDCRNLTAVALPSSMATMDETTFAGCNALNQVVYAGTQENWAVVGGYAWAGIPDSVAAQFLGNKLPAGTVLAVSSPVTYQVDGTSQDVVSYLIDSNNYIKIRDLALLLKGTNKQFDVLWNQDNQCIELIGQQPYTVVGGKPVTQVYTTAMAQFNTDYPIYFNGETLGISSYLIGENTYFKLRDVMKLMDVQVGWNQTAQTVTLDTSGAYTD